MHGVTICHEQDWITVIEKKRVNFGLHIQEWSNLQSFEDLF